MNNIITKKDLAEQTKQIQRYIRMLSEDFQSKVKVIGEQYLSIKEKLDATFEMTGETKEEVEMIKIDIRIMKRDIKDLKHDVGILKSDVSILKNDVKILKGDVKDLKKNDTIMNKNIIEIKEKLDYKADIEALNDLEDKVVLLERKFATV